MHQPAPLQVGNCFKTFGRLPSALVVYCLRTLHHEESRALQRDWFGFAKDIVEDILYAGFASLLCCIWIDWRYRQWGPVPATCSLVLVC
jgi:hypothetical protein